MDRHDEHWKPRDVARLLSLVEAERRYAQEMVACLPVAVAVVAEDLTLSASNEVFRRVFGLTPERARQAPLDELLPLEGLADHARQILEAGGRYSITYRDVPVKAGPRTLRITMTGFRGWEQDAGPELLVVIEDMHDVWEKAWVESAAIRWSEKLEAEQRRQEARLHTEKMAALGRLGGRVAHDCNNLLMIVRGYGEELRSALPAESTQRTNVEEILAAANRLAGLSQRLVTLTPRPMQQPLPYDLNAAIQTQVEKLRSQPGSRVEMVTNLAPDLGRTATDPAAMDDVIAVLAARARDAMPDGGRLSIETAAVELIEGSDETIGGLAPGAYLTVRISDTGAPLDADTHGRLFEPFFAQEKLHRELDIAWAVVRNSGGDIRVSSEAGKGTTFTVYLPRMAAVEAPPAAETNLVPLETVLVVEDEGGIRSLMRRILQREGYQVLEAGDGEEALSVAGAHPETIHLLLTDVVMPRMNGRELAERLYPKRPGIKVLYVSGYTSDAVVRAATYPTGAGFLQKPFTLDALLGKVRQILTAA